MAPCRQTRQAAREGPDLKAGVRKCEVAGLGGSKAGRIN